MNKPVILCVDDEKMILTSLKEQLKRHFGDEYSIETVESGEEAIELLKELQDHIVDMPVVIADQIMPGIKGDELLKRMHALCPKTLKIMLTGQANADAVGNAVNYAQLYRYIAKPWDETDLKLTVSEALRSYFQDKKLEEQNITLHRLNEELEHWNATLEQQVKERTSELEAQKIALAEMNASKDKFFSIISHDLRGSFGTLLGFAQLVTENFEHYSQDKIKAFAVKMRVSAEKLYALLENLLTWSKIQRGAMERAPRRIDLHDIAQENLDLFASQAEHKQITLSSGIPQGTAAYADQSMVTTVLRNLISNALKFTAPGGRVSVAATECDEHFLAVAVADTGVGIPAEELLKLFRIDTHYKHVGTAGEQGTGLGLILCKELVEKNGGRVAVASAIDQGTTFTFTLPRQPLE